jgi:Cytochrome c
MRDKPFLFIAILFSCLSCNINVSAVEGKKPEFDSEDINRGKAVYKKSNCAFCHGWAGDGQGHPRSPGAAANLRRSVLDRVSLTHIIRCGVPGGAMPFHDRMAYRDQRCGVTADAIDSNLLPQKGKNISEANLDALVAYIMTVVKGKGEVTFEQCENYFKSGSRNCLYLQAKYKAH